MKDLGIIICNFNKVDYLKGCLKTLYKSDFENLTFDIIVVDNASEDESPKFVKENYPEIILLENIINTGGSGGFDRGIIYTIEKEYKYVALLDNDILLEKDTLLNLVKHIQANPKVGVVGSKICTMDNPEVLQEMGSFIDFEKNFNITTPLKGHKDNSSLPEVVKCDYVPACCLITTKEVLKKVGSFNIDHFIYWDDMDWCTRIKRIGYEVHAINNSRVFHKMGVANHTNTFGVYYFGRNRILFYLKYLHKEKLDLFINTTADWLLSVTFFSNLKKNKNTAISLLLALDDLLQNNLGRRDESILNHEKTETLFEKFNLQKEDKIIIYFCDNMETNRKIYNHFKDYYTHIDIFCHTNNQKIIRNNFNQNIITDENILENNYANIFYCLDHILDVEKSNYKNEKTIYIDSYINYSSQKEIKQLLHSYNSYNEIFNNIFKPVIIKKLYNIRDSYEQK